MKHRHWETRRKHSRRTFVAGGAALTATSLGLGCASAAPVERTGKAQDPKHPLEGLTSFYGKNLDLPDVVGNVTVLDFWASWCAPCRQAFKHLDQLYRTYKRDGLQLIAVSIDEDPEEGRRFAARMRPRFSLAWDAASNVRQRFSVTNLPTTILLDEEGKVGYRHEGFDLVSHQTLEGQLRRRLRGL